MISSAAIAEGVRKRPIATVFSLIGVILFGVIDSFTSKIVPKITEKIENYFDPPTVTLNLPYPIKFEKQGVFLRRASADPADETVSTYSIISSSTLIVQATPGSYIVTFHRDNNGQTEVASAAIRFEKSGDSLDVKVAQNDWRSPKALSEGTTQSTAEAPASPSNSFLVGTRWTTTPEDYALVAAAPSAVTKALLALSLVEVGVDENGSEQDKKRIKDYWKAVPSWTGSTDNVAWGGTFLSWVVSGAGVASPQSAAFMSWKNWGTSVAKEDAKPGMIAIYQRIDIPEAPSRLLVGVILRIRPDCTEIIAGNVVDHVSISCVKGTLVDIRMPPARPV